ncbi:hypothetical protein SeMB42_g02111 [Synchytrium endobioticum]|uniref:Uncharacterized protein n=1 Tax=Synchytrium endobioticum TaxID=286115 RepID=A0A507CXR8_9FUNG|nr:hypothetical protein SeLEV6574_g04759 [Synchytrium endobioticum]TPX50815.1 hypothetical protein SeMB42_g02111 [Synchytrium endobioticum]
MSDNVAHAISGATGGMFSMALTYPLVTVSTRAQVTAKKQGTSKQTGSSALKNIIKEEGISGLYSGIESALFGIGVTNGVYYYWYELVKAFFDPTSRGMTTAESMIAGAIAGSATTLITNPIWVLNTRMTVSKNTKDPNASKPTTIGTALKIFKDSGPAEFWRGVGPALVLVINPIIQYTVFEQLLAKVKQWKKGQALSPWDFFWLGAVSKLAATGFTYPYITVKARMQVQTKVSASSDPTTTYSSAADAFVKILRHEGVLGFYQGISSKLLQSVLTAAFLFMLKEQLFGFSVFLMESTGMRPKKVAVAAA